MLLQTVADDMMDIVDKMIVDDVMKYDAMR